MLELSQKQFSIKPWEILEKMGGHTVTRLNNFTVLILWIVLYYWLYKMLKPMMKTTCTSSHMNNLKTLFKFWLENLKLTFDKISWKWISRQGYRIICKVPWFPVSVDPVHQYQHMTLVVLSQVSSQLPWDLHHQTAHQQQHAPEQNISIILPSQLQSLTTI